MSISSIRKSPVTLSLKIPWLLGKYIYISLNDGINVFDRLSKLLFLIYLPEAEITIYYIAFEVAIKATQ